MIVYRIKIIQHTGDEQGVERLIFDSSLVDDTFVLDEPTVTSECGKAGALDFKIYPNNPDYDRFYKLTTEVVGTENDNEIFRGRVYETEIDINKVKTVKCEGDISYLADSIQDPDRKKVDVSGSKTLSSTEFIANHKDLTVTDTRPVTCVSSKDNVVPTITVNTSMSVTFNGTSYNLNSGANVIQAIKFSKGDNLLTFSLRAVAYDSTKTYDVGDSVYFEGDPYTCTEAVLKPEEFSWYKWQLISGIINSIVYETDQPAYSTSYSTYEDDGVKETIAQHFYRLITNHNAEMSDNPWKQFTVGYVTVDEADKAVKFDSAKYRSTFEAIDSDIIDYYGGYLRTRRVGDVTFIDLLKDYTVTASQHLTFGENVIELTDTRSAEDIFTVLIPIGDDDLTIKDVNGGNKMLVNSSMVAKYGKIYKCETFNGISDASALKSAAQKYMDRECDLDPCDITITAYDLRHTNPSAIPINIGDKVVVDCEALGLSKTVTCKKKTIKMLHPEDTEYDLGKQVQSLSTKSDKDSSRNSESAAGANARGGAAGGAASRLYKTITEHGNDLIIKADKIDLLAKEINLLNGKIQYYEKSGITWYNLKKSIADLMFVEMLQAKVYEFTSQELTLLFGRTDMYGAIKIHGTNFTINGENASDPIMNVTESGYSNNVNTVTFTKLQGGTQIIHFSRAIGSFTVTGSGGWITVNTTPQDQSAAIQISYSYKKSGKGYNVKVNFKYGSTIGTCYEAWLDAGGVYEDGYGKGWDDGYSQGYDDGYSQGYDDNAGSGYGAGWAAGYQAGYRAGVDSV